MYDQRPPAASNWYPQDARACGGTVEAYRRDAPPPKLPNPLHGGVVPHAGWSFSGMTAARTHTAIARNSPPPEVLIVLGAVHVPGVDQATTCSYTAWHTPVGQLHVDAPLRRRLVRAGVVEVDDRAHDREHSIEVQAPMLRYLMPDTHFVPIAVPAAWTALRFGDQLADVLYEEERRVAVIASSDLTHYGVDYDHTPGGTGDAGMAWARANDEELLAAVQAMDADAVLEHASRRRSACGAGAIAASILVARSLGARRGVLLERTSSHEQNPEHSMGSWVGYASVVFAP